MVVNVRWSKGIGMIIVAEMSVNAIQTVMKMALLLIRTILSGHTNLVEATAQSVIE